ncbi:MAG: hypothetical protein IKC76_06135 [Firmicutes bacterium]|nr:hypothetical protein [Bacillota bacterium]
MSNTHNLNQEHNREQSHALEYMIAATQILTLICLFKGNPAWKGSLSLLFFGGATQLFSKYRSYREKPYLYVGGGLLLIGILLLMSFALN